MGRPFGHASRLDSSASAINLINNVVSNMVWANIKYGGSAQAQEAQFDSFSVL